MAAEFKVTSNASEYEKVIADKRVKIMIAAKDALRQTATQAADDARREYRSRFSANNLFWQSFGERWKARVFGKDDKVRAVVSHPSGLTGEIERTGTATIHGKPLLWLPTTDGAPPASQSGKHLVSATVRGQPMLFDADDPDREKKPLYVGVPTVRVQVGIRVLEIVKKNLGEIDKAFQIRD